MSDLQQAGLGIDEIIGDKREQIVKLATGYGAANVRVFGSVARGEAFPDSDLDLLVTFLRPYKLRDLIRLTQALQALLDRPVQVVDEAALRDELRPDILKDAAPL